MKNKVLFEAKQKCTEKKLAYERVFSENADAIHDHLLGYSVIGDKLMAKLNNSRLARTRACDAEKREKMG